VKLAFVFPAMLVGGRPLDFDAVDTSPRGTTGSETQILSMAREMAARGHVCSLYIAQEQAFRSWEGVWIHALPPQGGATEGVSPTFDATFVSLDVNFFQNPPWFPGKRVVFQQLNDFNYAEPGALAKVDLFVSPSEPHREHMEEVSPETKGRWAVVPNGCRLADFAQPSDDGLGADPDDVEREPGRVIYCSSPDRGLHLLLQEWPAIRRAVPHATLKIFYYSLARWLEMYLPFEAEQPGWLPFHRESWRRVRYIDRALKALEPQGVELVGSISRKALAAEMLQAEVLAYPCDPILYTEGFSCATLEGCASGALPIISGADALGRIYRGAVPMVPGPARKHISAWSSLVIRALQDPAWAENWRERARALAEKHEWAALAEKLEGILQEKLRA
jgi:glycosyltransferase involved in cell wall biosynthesis